VPHHEVTHQEFAGSPPHPFDSAANPTGPNDSAAYPPISVSNLPGGRHPQASPPPSADAAGRHPEAVKTRPDAAESHSEAAKSGPDAAGRHPETTTSRPDAAESYPEAAKSRPNVAESHPKAAESHPEASPSLSGPHPVEGGRADRRTADEGPITKGGEGASRSPAAGAHKKLKHKEENEGGSTDVHTSFSGDESAGSSRKGKTSSAIAGAGTWKGESTAAVTNITCVMGVQENFDKRDNL
jgi:hypothetical protein